jgi:hypothetical protein
VAPDQSESKTVNSSHVDDTGTTAITISNTRDSADKPSSKPSEYTHKSSLPIADDSVSGRPYFLLSYLESDDVSPYRLMRTFEVLYYSYSMLDYVLLY